MSALLIACQLACGSFTIGESKPSLGSIQINGLPREDWSITESKLLSIRRDGDEILYFDSRGGLHLIRWCTPWDIAEALLESLPQPPTVDI